MFLTSKITVSQKSIFYSMVALFWYSMIIVDIVRKLSLDSALCIIIRNALYIMVLVYAVFHALKHAKEAIIIVPIAVFLLISGVSYMVYPELKEVVGESIVLFVGRCVPGFYFAICINDWKSVIEKICKWHWIAMAYSLMIIIMGQDIFDNYMSLSYALLLPAMLCVCKGLQDKRILLLLSGSVMLLAILTYGARGPVVCIIASIIFMILESNDGKRNSRKIILLFFLMLCAIFIFFFYDVIINYFANHFPTSRTITMLVKGNIMDTSGRNDIFTIILGALKINPLIPHGFLSDRLILGSIGHYEGIYPHNLFLEIWYQFGVFGLLILGWIIVRMIRNGYYTYILNDSNVRIVYISFVLIAFVKLMFTGSYVSDMQAWFAFGTLISITKVFKSSLMNDDR